MSRFVFVSIQHEESKKSTCEAHTQFSKKQNDISNHIHFSDPKDVVNNQLGCDSRRLAEALARYRDLHESE